MALSPAASNGDIKSDVQRLLSQALHRPVGDTENPSRETETGWDSFTHVDIVCRLEDHFQIRFDGREIAGLHDAHQILRLLEARLAP